MPDGTIVTFADGKYTAIGDTVNDMGSYVALDYANEAFIQFRAATETPVFSKTYRISYGVTQDGKTDNSEIILQPYILGPSQSFGQEDHILILDRYFESQNETE